MPIRPPLGCQHPSCRGIAETGTSYCKDHAKIPLEEARERDTFRRHNYPWRKWYKQNAWTQNLQPACLARDPLCKLQITPLCAQHGGDASVLADHIVDHHGDPKRFYDLSNLQGACRACHDAKGKTRIGKAAGKDLVMIGDPGKIFTSCSDPEALKRAMADDTEDLSDVTNPTL
jgi:5-methylcytosine-specific restriction endonuclease McrA